jgi:hypothetical protein
MTGQEGRTGWASAMAGLAATGERFAAEMAARGHPVESGDVFATMLGALSDTWLNQIAADAACPGFLPCTGYYQRLGSPNPDTVYRRAPIDPAGTYRLTGHRGSAQDVSIMPFSQTMQSFRPFDLSDVADRKDGSFDLIVSADRPAGHDGDWWRLDPQWASLWLREVEDDWGSEDPVRIAITRIDTSSRKRQAGPEVAEQLAGLALRVERIVEYGIRHADALADEGHVNRLKSVDYGASGGMPRQWYHEGIFELADDECLLVEAQIPADCRYFSWSLTDRMLVTLDWANAHTSLNTKQAAVDADGFLRVVVSAQDPGTPNWMETMGYRTGVLQCRATGCAAPPGMAARVMPLRSVSAALPEGTRRIEAGERLDILRQRQIGAQLRRLW